MKDNKSQKLLLHNTPTSISVTLPEQSFHSIKFLHISCPTRCLKITINMLFSYCTVNQSS